MENFVDRLNRIEDCIARACESAGRRRADVTLVAVSKTHPVEAIQVAYEAGLRDFGESRVQEALPKIDALPEDIRWHFVGKLQSNKLRKVAPRLHALHTMESASQLHELGKLEEPVPAFIEVNIARESQKSGLMPEDLPEFVESVLHSKNVHWLGLMAIGPVVDDPKTTRKYFRLLWELNERFGGQYLSIGMSDDFEMAIQEGSTHIRVGSALFGQRT